MIGFVESRSDEISLLGSMARSKLQSSKIADLINAAENEKNLDFWQVANLKEIKKQVKEITSNKASAMECTKYDALIDDYDPDRQENHIKHIFEVLKKKLPKIIGTVIDKQKSYDPIKIKPIEVDLQKRIVKKIMHVMGFDFTRGRLDESTHPFCEGTPFNVRIANRYQEKNFL